MEEKTLKKRIVRVGDTIVIFRDPMTEKTPEGWARVWEVLEELEDRFILYVSFMGDKKERKVTRDYLKYEPVKNSEKTV